MSEAKKHHHIGTDPSTNINTSTKELDEVLCPICMDHPHNAVLLLCSSKDKGCNSYICDTSYRHSNCLDRFKKLQNNSSNDENAPNEETTDTLKCPLCRGDVLGVMVVEESRKYLDQKVKGCSRESCGFIGNYSELRRHARRAHPLTRPGAVDPTRQRAWHRLERRQEYGDVLSAIRSAMPGAVVFGDYVIEVGDENRVSRARAREEARGGGPGPWWTPFVLFQTRRNEQREEEEEEEEGMVRRRRRRRRRFVQSRSQG